MEHPNHSPEITNHPSGAERRAYVRYPISLPAKIRLEGIGNCNAEARDFCLGGILLALTDNALEHCEKNLQGTNCLVTLDINGDDYRLRASVARCGKDFLGLALINPDQMALKALQQHAKVDAQPTSQNNSGKTNDAVPQSSINDSDNKVTPETFSLIINACNRKVLEYVPLVLKRFLTEINDFLFESAKQESDLAIQNKYFKSLESLNSFQTLISSTFSNQINSALNKSKELKNDSEIKEADLSAESLSLIGDEEFNIWLASSKIISKVELEYPDLLGELEKRLSVVYSQSVDRRNNPYNPCLFVEAFQDALNSIELDNLIKPAVYDAFRNVFVAIAKQLYTDLNSILIEQNILPTQKDVIAYARNIKVDGNEQQQSLQDDANDTVIEEEEIEKTESDSGANPTEHHSDKSILSERDKQKAVDDDLSQMNVYDLVGQIRDLQSQLQAITPAQKNEANLKNVEGVNTGEVSAPAQQKEYSANEVIDIISSLSVPHAGVSGDGESIGAFRESLNKKIQSVSGDADAKALSIRQEQVIDVTENIFKALLGDLQVAQSVRPWIEKLAVPIVKMALLDEGIFTNKNHIVREVINKLARLEVLASAEDEDEQAAVKQAFSWVVQTINSEFDGTTKVYERVANQLDLLVNVQQQSFDKNIKLVVSEAVREEQETEKQPQEGELIDSESEQPGNDRWMKMVGRLKESHWVLFDDDDENTRRLKVAWIAPHKGKYVFVNVMGRKDRIHTDVKLAELFESGKAIVLDDSIDPALDRAQYSMLQKMHQQLLFQSSHDELTGLINRREFLTCMQHALEESRQSKHKHAIIFIDIDDFKVVNNNYGYEAGDKLLLEAVKCFKDKLSEENVLARLGADQFTILLQETSIDEAVEFIENVMDSFDDYRFEWESNRLNITISAGVGVITEKSNDISDLLQTVESSCKIAKESGGDQVQIAHAGSSRLARRKKEIEWASRIDNAIEKNALYLRCQKIAPSNSELNQLQHYEILLGISDELVGAKSLGDFIQAAEQHNRMYAVDRWVIETAFRWLAENEDTVSDVSMFTINLSGQSLNNEQLIEFIYDQVHKTSVPIEKICFEVTETAGVTSLSDAADFIETIKETGCKFALDDFGTGMSSYSYLKNLPVDYLKIDGVFIEDILNNKNDFAVVKSICEIGHFMEKKVIAEFVQDDESAVLLRDIGVDYLQGYGVERPHLLNDLLK